MAHCWKSNFTAKIYLEECEFAGTAVIFINHQVQHRNLYFVSLFSFHSPFAVHVIITTIYVFVWRADDALCFDQRTPTNDLNEQYQHMNVLV